MASLSEQVAANAAAIQQILASVKTLAQLTTITSLDDTDFIIVVDSTDGKGKKILKTNFGTNIKSIGGFIVDVTNNVDKTIIEVGNIIYGEISANRFIIARVNALPYTIESNLSIYVDSGIII